MKTINAGSLFTLAPRTAFKRLQAWLISHQIRAWEDAKNDIRRFRADGIRQEWQIEEEQKARRLRLRALLRQIH